MKQTLKKSLSIILVAAILICSAPIAELAEFPFLDSVSEFFGNFSSKAEAATSGTCGANVYWNLDEATGTLTISGTGKMKDMLNYRDHMFSDDPITPWAKDDIKRVIIEDGVTSIGEYAFSDHYNLYEIQIADSVVSIGEGAFQWCNSLLSLTLPEHITSIPEIMCSLADLRYVYIPAGVTVINDGAFYYTSLIEIEFGGTEEQWNNVVIKNNNDKISDAHMVFNHENVLSETQSGSCGDNVTWKLTTDGTLTISGNGHMDSYQEAPISSYGTPNNYGDSSDHPWFKYRSKIKKIIISSGVVSVGEFAFFDCFNCTSLEIQNGVTTIKEAAFAFMPITTLSIPDSVVTLERDNFYNCGALQEIILSDNITVIDYNSFEYCQNVKSLDLPNNLKIIKNSAFYGCHFDEITIPANVECIESFASVNTVHFLGALPLFDEDGYYTEPPSSILNADYIYCLPEYYDTYKEVFMKWRASGVLSNGPLRAKLNKTYLTLTESNFIYQLSVTDESGNISSFTENWWVEKPEIATVDNTGIVTASGHGETMLHVEISANGYRSIASCSVTTKRNDLMVSLLPQNIEADFPVACSISSKYHGEVDTSSYYPHKLAETDTSNEYYQKLLALTNDLTAGCTNDEQKARAIWNWVSKNITYGGAIGIGTYASQAYAVYVERKAHCEGFAKLTGFMLYLAGIPSCLVTTPGHMLNIALLDGVWTMIDSTNSKFGGDYNSFGAIEWIGFGIDDLCFVIDNTEGIKLAGVGDHPLTEYREIYSSIVIPDYVDIIFGDAFDYCKNLKSVTLPKNIKKISRGAFSDCSKLKEVYYAGSEEQWNSITIKDDNDPLLNANIHFNRDSAITTGTCGKNAVWDFNEETGTLTISGTGNMYNWVQPNYAPWYSFCENIKSVKIENGITNIGAGAFYECKNLADVRIGKDVTSIGSVAFIYCENLKNITIPETVTSIGTGAFSYSGLANIILPSSITKIDLNTFAYCDNLKTVTIPDSVTSIGNSAFNKCNNLTDVYYCGTESKWHSVTIGNYNNDLLNANIHYNHIPNIHIHSYTSSVTTPATCTKNGVMTYTCECGDSYTESIPYTHSPQEWQTLVEPTCKVAGEKIQVCRICVEVVNREPIPVKDHTPGEWTIVTEATCKTEGKRVRTCTVCSDEVNFETIPVKAHTPGGWEVTKNADCETDGTKVLKCTSCGTTLETENIPATGHEESEEYFVNSEPTCSQTGIKQKRCIHCGKAMGNYVTIPKTEHTPNDYFVNVLAPTCTETGLKVKKCKVCGEAAVEETIPANGHLSGGDWIIETYPSCGGAGRKVKYCSVCGEISQEILINPEGHTSSDEWLIRKEATCTEAGELYKKCTVCGMDTETKEAPALGHNYGEWIISVPATCTENGSKSRICTRCEHIESDIILSTGHDLEVEWKTVTPATCTQNGTMARFCKNCDHSLTRDIPATGHNSGDWTVTVKESCENTGTKVKRCITCGAVLETETIPATGHTIGEWEIIKKADCKNTGTKVKRCTKCSNVIHSESIPVTGHEGGNWIITKVPSGGNYGIKSKFCIGCGMKLEEKIIHSISTSVVRDAVTGIEIVYPEETYEGTVTVRARNLSGSELGGRIYDHFGECVYRGYEAVLYNDGVQAVPANSYSLRLPVPEGMNHKTAEVYGIDMNTGAFFKASASYDGGYFLIEKVDAIQYVIIEKIIKLSLSQTSLSMKKGDAVQLYADTNGYNVIYTSSDTSVATVDIYGNVTAVGAGTATITATVEDTDVKAECSVEVTQSFFEMIIEAFTNFFKMLAELFGF